MPPEIPHGLPLKSLFGYLSHTCHAFSKHLKARLPPRHRLGSPRELPEGRGDPSPLPAAGLTDRWASILL